MLKFEAENGNRTPQAVQECCSVGGVQGSLEEGLGHLTLSRGAKGEWPSDTGTSGCHSDFLLRVG